MTTPNAAAFAADYIAKLAWALVPIPAGSKAPNSPGWNQAGNAFTDPTQALLYWRNHPDQNMGLLLGASGMVTLDIDHMGYTKMLFAELGWDYETLLAQAPRLIGNPERDKALFRAPANLTLDKKALAWPGQDGGKPITIFELRGGPNQDLLPPSIHPSGRPYEWRRSPFEGIPELPAELLTLWRDWPRLKGRLEAICPWAPEPKPTPQARPAAATRTPGESVIAAFNAAHDLRALLEAHGYRKKGQRYGAPSSESGIPGVVLLDDGTACFSHHGGDPLANGHSHDAFDVFRLLEHGGDWKAAVKAAAQVLGIARPARHRGDQGSGSTPPSGAATDQPPAGDNRPVIIWEPGFLPRSVDEAEAALLADKTGEPIYQRGGLLVRVVYQPPVSAHPIERRLGGLGMVPVEPPWLLERLTRCAQFQKWDSRQKGFKRINVPELVVKVYLARQGMWNLPRLVGFVEAPTLRPDGSLLEQPGYDEATGLLFEPGPTTFPPIPAAPTLAEAREAVAVLTDLLKGFPFEQQHDRAVALSAILTALVRKSLRSAPMHVFTAPKMGSGKSLLADVVALIATGRPAAAMTHTEDANDERKRLFSVLLDGDAVALIDNVEKPLGSDALCSILTQQAYKDRVLGASRTVTVPTCCTWLASGNNLQVIGDLTSRVLPCRLDPRCEHPEQRQFDVDLYETIPTQRPALVKAGLTLLRAYVVAGQPAPAILPFGRFEAWSDLIRSALVWVGLPDPCLSRRELEQADPIRSQIREMMDAWRANFGRQPTTIRAAIDRANKGFVPEDEKAARDALRDILGEIAGLQGEINARRLGAWLSKYEKRVEGKSRFFKVGSNQGVAQWQLVDL